MSEADILALTYEDSVTVYRPTRQKNDDGETVANTGTKGAKVYDKEPCALSRPSGGKLNQGPPAATAPTDYSLFVRPEVDILKGDTLEVTHLGRTELFKAGKADRQPSHNNVPVTQLGGTQ